MGKPTLISIHALAKRATDWLKNLAGVDFISIHALAKRATLRNVLNYIQEIHFNPRPRKEGDRWFDER